MSIERQQMHHVNVSDARSFVERVLIGNGCLVDADLAGVDTHGMNRIQSYMARVREGVLDATASPTIHQVTPAVAQHNGSGFLAASMGMAAAIDMASKIGVGLVSVKHSNHFGMSAWVVHQALDADMMSLVFTNSSPALPAWGGRSKLMGISPIACGAPAGNKGRPGEKVPSDWALSKDGRRTEDPAEAFEGVMLPMGGPKGSALAIMMDVFSGVFSGSAFAGHVTNPYDPTKPADVGHFLVAIKPGLFVTIENFRQRMDYLYHRVVGSDKMEGTERIYFPGEIEDLNKEERIPLLDAEVEALNQEAARVGAAPLTTTPPATNARL
ncbi:Malate/L-lactate dehydrogenase [Setomelanomma holmii]|uniref:Malate/L-lactate dehydrogenase n=1 Tax=Setomelanomma holmii TaxID=210430 RepID=A0A9P4HGB8_9PLEO|nr:Malate/L-lactate dehydrogenase [Setomelanomma holmii]